MMLAGGALLIGGGVISARTMEDREQATKMATVVGGVNLDTDSDGDGSLDARYTVEVREPGEPGGAFIVETDLRLRINERVFVDVRNQDGSAELAGVLDDGRLGVSIVMAILGAGLLVSARRSHVWTTRCRQLAALTADLHAQGQ